MIIYCKDIYIKKTIEATRSALNELIKNHPNRDFPSYIVKHENSVTKNKEEIANEFSDYFVDVGPNLAKEIEQTIDEDMKFDFALKNIILCFLEGFV